MKRIAPVIIFFHIVAWSDSALLSRVPVPNNSPALMPVLLWLTGRRLLFQNFPGLAIRTPGSMGEYVKEDLKRPFVRSTEPSHFGISNTND